MSENKQTPLICPECNKFVSRKTLTCKSCGHVINLNPTKEKTMSEKTTPLKPSEKKELVVKSQEALAEKLTAGTVINMDNRGSNLSNTSQRFKALVVKNGELVNISKDVAQALCLRPSKDGLTLMVNGTDPEMLAKSTVETLGKVLFNDAEALSCAII